MKRGGEILFPHHSDFHCAKRDFLLLLIIIISLVYDWRIKKAMYNNVAEGRKNWAL